MTAGFSAALALLALLTAQLLWAGPGAGPGADFETLFETSFTDVRLGSGQVVHREFDEQGRTTLLIVRDATLAPEYRIESRVTYLATGKTITEREYRGGRLVGTRVDRFIPGHDDVRKTDLKPGQAAPVLASDPTKDYAKCLCSQKGSSSKGADCVDTARAPLLAVGKSAAIFDAGLSCVDTSDNVLHVPSGYRIDLESCGDEKSGVAAIYALRTAAARSQKITDSSTRDNAWTQPGISTGLVLGLADPTTHAEFRKLAPQFEVSPSEIRALPTRDERIEAHVKNYPVYAPEPSLAPLIFHESMHLALFKLGDNGHRYDDPTDEVYSCTQLCSGPATKTSEASCLGCMKAKGHAITDDDRAFCKRHFGVPR
ncbi:MAG: hypothetical protein HY075_07665 [Deltaproteobacteria bacterium]|nr:hypothetical protein [Deltaproteobacteria bacterium]